MPDFEPSAPWPLVCAVCYQPWTDEHDCPFGRSPWRRLKDWLRHA